jgi:pyruvate/2-oxoglutarate dehydrogenase complex dihydrolipoamide dehydrogenase (E3) component
MSQPEEYDVVVLGSGAPGKLLAWTLASQGKRTPVVERRYVGWPCQGPRGLWVSTFDF